MRVAAASIVILLVLIFPFHAYSAGIGEKAPAFSLKDMKGNIVTLESLKGKVLFVDFWATWCSPCKEELPALDALYRKYGKEGFEIIGISVDKSESSVIDFLTKRPVSFTVLTDKSGHAAESFNLAGMPTGFLIGRDGVINQRYAGFSQSFLSVYEKQIVDLLNKK